MSPTQFDVVLVGLGVLAGLGVIAAFRSGAQHCGADQPV